MAKRYSTYSKGQTVYLTDPTHPRYGEAAVVCTVRHTPFGSVLWSYDIAFPDTTIVESLEFGSLSWKAPCL